MFRTNRGRRIEWPVIRRWWPGASDEKRSGPGARKCTKWNANAMVTGERRMGIIQTNMQVRGRRFRGGRIEASEPTGQSCKGHGNTWKDESERISSHTSGPRKRTDWNWSDRRTGCSAWGLSSNSRTTYWHQPRPSWYTLTASQYEQTRPDQQVPADCDHFNGNWNSNGTHLLEVSEAKEKVICPRNQIETLTQSICNQEQNMFPLYYT